MQLDAHFKAGQSIVPISGLDHKRLGEHCLWRKFIVVYVWSVETGWTLGQCLASMQEINAQLFLSNVKMFGLK